MCMCMRRRAHEQESSIFTVQEPEALKGSVTSMNLQEQKVR